MQRIGLIIPFRESRDIEEEEDDDGFLHYPSDALEEILLNKYFLLVKRVEGIGLSLNDFWEMDTKQFNLLYNNELEIIQAEQKEIEKHELAKRSKSTKGKMVTTKGTDNPEMSDAYESLMK